MYGTNPLLLDLLNLLTALLPLLPLLLVLLRRSWHYEPLGLLMVLCLILLASGILSFSLGNHPAEQHIVSDTSGLMEFCILLFFYRSVLHSRLSDYILVSLLAIFLVGGITYCIARGFPQNSTFFFVAAKTVLLLISIYLLTQTIQTQVHILDSPAFWITVGICFQASIFILVSLLSYYAPQTLSTRLDESLLLSMLRIIQLLFFSFGAWIYHPKAQQP